MSRHAVSRHDESGSAVVAVGGTAAAIGVVLLVICLDLAAYLAAASDAQAAADHAALAAVAVADPRGRQLGSPSREAARVADAAGARVESCRCAAGDREVEVSVSVAVRGILITRYAPRRVTATAQARLVPP